MKYKDFDKLVGRGSANRIYLELEKEAFNIDELGEKVGLDRTSVFYHLRNFIKAGKVEKRMLGKRAYYGLLSHSANNKKESE